MRCSLFSLLLGLVLVAAACGDDRVITTAAPAITYPEASTTAPSMTTSVEASITMAELPPPDPDTYVGAARVVNLYVDGDGNTLIVDIWGRRTFTNGPIVLAEGVGFGEASDYFAAPDGYVIHMVETGEGPDADEVGSLFNPAEGEQSTTLLIWDGEGSASASLLFPEVVSPDSIFEVAGPPDAGTGLIILQANQLNPHGDDLSAAAFYVGTPGADDCLPQSPLGGLGDGVILGGTQPSYHEVAPGPFEFTLHPWPSGPGVTESCAEETVYPALQIEVPDGGRAWVFLYTTDGLATVAALTLPWARE